MSQELDLLTKVCVTVTDIQNDVSTIRTIVTGNGDPEKGLVTRLTRLEDSVANCQENSEEWQNVHDQAAVTTNKNRASIICAVIAAIAAISASVVVLLK